MASLRCKEVLCMCYTFLVFVLALFTLGFTVVLAYRTFYHFKFVPDEAVAPVLIFFFLGLLHLLSTWLGVRGPQKKHDLHVYFFVFVTVLLAVIEFVTSAWSTRMLIGVPAASATLMNSSFDALLRNDLDKSEWNRMQKKFYCCGINGVEDYYTGKLSIPTSCCKKQEKIGSSPCPSLYETGCVEPMINYARTILIDVLWLGYSSGAFRIAGVVIYLVFAKALKKERAKRLEELAAARRREGAAVQT